MEPTDSYFIFIFNIAVLVILALIPWAAGLITNKFSNKRKVFLVGKILSILLSVLILAFFSISPFLFKADQEYLNEPFHFFVMGSILCGLFFSILPLSTFYFLASKKIKRRFLCIFGTFVIFFVILTGYEHFVNRCIGFVFETKRQELPLDEFYRIHPNADTSSDFNIFIQEDFRFEANLSVHRDFTQLKSMNISFHDDTTRCSRDDLQQDSVLLLIEEIINYRPEKDYCVITDMCEHPALHVDLAVNKKNSRFISLSLEDLDRFHPKAQNLARLALKLVKSNDFDRFEGCRD